MSQNGIKDSHKYNSSNATITAGPGVMYNEVTKMKPINTRVNENTKHTHTVHAYLVALHAPKSLCTTITKVINEKSFKKNDKN